MNRMSGGPEPHGLLHGLAEVCVVCLCRMTLCKTIPNTFIFCIVCKRVSLRQVSGSVTQVRSIGSDNSKFSSQGSSRTQDSYTTSTTILGRMREDGEAQAREDARRQQEDEQSEEETEYMGVQEDMSINIEYQQEQEPVPAVSVNSKTLQKAADAGSKKSREVRSYGR
jgi:hypothetical protein